MKLVFGIVSLLIVLAVVGKLASTQLSAVRGSSAAPDGDAATTSVPAQSRRLQEQVTTDVTKALEQGAAARREAADQ